MGETIKIFPYNILEHGTVTVTGTPDTGYAEERMWDRSVNLYWKDTVTEAKTFQVNQGSNIKSVDMLFIAGHNFDGEDITWDWSTDGEAWTESAGWTQSGFDNIVKTISALSKQYWRVTVTSILNPMCAEIYMGAGYSFGVQARPDPMHDLIANVQWRQSIGAQERAIKLGATRQRRDYVVRMNSSELANLVSLLGDLDDLSLPFIVKDKDGNYHLMRFDEAPSRSYFDPDITEARLSLIEVL